MTEKKDVVDLWQISLNSKVNWQEVFLNAQSKAVGISPVAIAQKLDSFPLELLKQINWQKHPPTPEEFDVGLQKIIKNMLLIDKKSRG